MKINAYQEIYLNSAQTHLGEAFDYAVNVCKIPSQDFIKIFVTSHISKCIEIGDPKYIQGMSGIELLIELLKDATGQTIEIAVEDRFYRTAEYWVGWAVAYYQWYSDRSFNDIFEAYPFDSLRAMYSPLHEADISKFIEIVDKGIKNHFSDTNLKRHRQKSGLSQSRLAFLSGVDLRSIQLYEQRRRDINKASLETVYRLAKILNCRLESLLEK
jgi:DNA-binding XRE family transcriptional regulator